MMMYPSIRFSCYAVAALLLLQSSSACRCSVSTDTITTHFMQISDAVGRFYIHNSISPIKGIDGSLYFIATASKWFKGDIGEGKLIVKTSASGSECGATVTVRASSILFGTISYTTVPGFAGTVPTLTIDSCKPQKVATTLSKKEWDAMTNYNKPLVCASTSCDGMKKPVPDVLPDCLPGTKYAETAECKGQDNGSCGWTVNATCTKLPDPDVCFEHHCDGLAKPDLSCPTGTILDNSSTYTCEKQTGGSCGWTGSVVCKAIAIKVAPKVVPPSVCADSDCTGLDKPILTPLSCPKTTVYSAKFTCEKQTAGSCGWTASAECKAGATKGNSGNFVRCIVGDCDKLEKPIVDALPCPDGEFFVESSTCEEQKETGTCGWNVGGQCQLKK
jgi:hypothetical protein